MDAFKIIIGIVLFALVTAILYVWGLKRTMTQSTDLNRILISKCSGKILKYLNKNNSITKNEIVRLIDGTKAGIFWSKNKMKIANAKEFSKDIIDFMINNKYIVKVGNKYILNK